MRDEAFTEAETPTTRTRLRALTADVTSIRHGLARVLTFVLSLQIVAVFLLLVVVLQTCHGQLAS
jgi:hypothetical protein